MHMQAWVHMTMHTGIHATHIYAHSMNTYMHAFTPHAYTTCTHAHAQAHISSHTQLVTSMEYFLSIGKDSAPTASRTKDPTRVGRIAKLTPSCWHLSGLSWDFQQTLPGPMSLSPHTSHLSPGEMLLSDKRRERESQA